MSTEVAKKLVVNLCYGQDVFRETEKWNDDIHVITLDPFRGNRGGHAELPRFLRDGLDDIVKNGVVIQKKYHKQNVPQTKEIRMSVEHIARGIVWNATLAQVTLLSQIADANTTEVDITGGGLVGIYSLRFLVGIEGIEVRFHNFPADWGNLSELVGIDKITVAVAAPSKSKHEKTVQVTLSPVEVEEAPSEAVAEVEVKATKPAAKKPTARKKAAAPAQVASDAKLQELETAFPVKTPRKKTATA